MTGAEHKRVAIIGVSSYVAGPLARLLSSKGYHVIGVARPSSDTHHIEIFLKEIVRGDLNDLAFVQQCTIGCVAIINMVGQVNPSPASSTDSLLSDQPPLDACLYAATKNNAFLIHTSGNFGLPTVGKQGAITSELDPAPVLNFGYQAHWSTYGLVGVDPNDVRCIIGESKFRQDHYLQMYLQAHPTAKACTLVLSATYGPGVGGKVSFWDHAFKWYQAGQFSDMKTGFIHVEDVARAYLALIDKGVSGGRYLVAGEGMLVSSFFAAYAKAAGVSLPEGCHKIADPGYFFCDASTKDQLCIQWERSVETSLPDLVIYLSNCGFL